MYSIFSTGSYAVIEALVRGGADVDLRNTHGESAISYVRMTDARRLEILNLLVNAVQATPEGGRVRLTARAEEGFLRVCVSDTGCGIKEEVRASIFKPFFTTKHIGTGLGLSIVQRIVNAHGGRIEIQSDPPEGSTFTVFLPLAAGSA